MEFNRELLFFFSALGAFNGLILGIYFLFFTKSKQISNQFLGALLLLLSIRIGKSVLLFFNPSLFELFIQIGLSACFLIGPTLYLYVVAATNPDSVIVKKWKYQFVPFLVLIMLVSYLYPYYERLDLWRGYLIRTIYWQWFIYIVLSGFYIRNTLKKITSKKEKLNPLEIWKTSIFIGVLVIWIAYMTIAYTSYITGALTFSFLLYILLLLLVFKKNKKELFGEVETKYADKKIESSYANTLISELNKIMNEEQLYKNANLKSSDVAKKIQLTTHQLSQLLNDNLGKSFPVFINEYKIEEAKRIIKTNSNLTLEAIGYECGFNSKSTFYTTFKRVVGSTPSMYKGQQ